MVSGLEHRWIRERRLQRVRTDHRSLSVASKTAINVASRRSLWMDWSRLREIDRERRDGLGA